MCFATTHLKLYLMFSLRYNHTDWVKKKRLCKGCKGLVQVGRLEVPLLTTLANTNDFHKSDVVKVTL